MNYTLTVGNKGGRIITIALARTLSIDEVNRANSLNRGLNPYLNTFGWDLTPVRAKKWALLFDGGWMWDEQGFFLSSRGNRWDLRDATKIAEDLCAARGAAA